MFYRTTRFLAVVVVCMVLAAGGAWRLHVARVRRQFALLIGERARLSRELHDTLLQSLVGIALQFDAMANDPQFSFSETQQHPRRSHLAPSARAGIGVMPKSRTIRVFCVDDHRIVRDGLALIIGRQPDMEVVGAASSAEEAIESYGRYRPDVTLMDLNLGGMGGLDAIKTIGRQDPQARISVLTMFNGEEHIHRALEAGAASYRLKDTLSDYLIGAIRDVYDGRSTLTPDVEARLAERASTANPTAERPLVSAIVND